MRSLQDWLAWAGAQHPKGIELGLDRVRAVWARLGAPHPGCPVITVGGTNGKGSCVAMAVAIAEAAGYRVGCYTSPHLVRYNERVRLEGREAEDAELVAGFERVAAARGDIPLTYFELGTLAALVYFAEAAPDLLVLEVGLGGRLDAVNLMDADVSVVTSIGWDHMDLLGDSLEAIAREKAGIFRPGRPAIIGQPDAPVVLREIAEGLGAPVSQVGREIGVAPADGGWHWSVARGASGGERLALPAPAMRGRYQYHNAAAAIAALRALGDRIPVPTSALRAGLLRAQVPGRFQVLPGTPTWILDVAHNPQAAEALASNLRALERGGRVIAVLGMLTGKDPKGLVRPLADLVNAWILTQSADPRAMAMEMLADRVAEALPGSELIRAEDVGRALELARGQAAAADRVLVLGSFSTVGEALSRLVVPIGGA